MTQSVTVLSGVSNSSISGLVTVPLDISPSVTALQALLTSESNSVAAGTYGLTNVNIVGLSGNYNTPQDSVSSGIIEYTNTSANGGVSTGSGGISTYYPSNYNTVIVQAPGDDTIKGEGSPNLLAILGSQSQVRFNPGGGNGTVIAGGGGDLIAVSNGPWSVDGSTDGNDTINANASSAVISTYGTGNAGSDNGLTSGGTPSNVVGIIGGAATVNSAGTADLIEAYNGASVLVSVTGSAAILVSGGVATVDAAAGSSSVNAFFETGGSLYFVNQSSVQAFVSGDAPGASGGNDTVFGGAGGGVYYGGDGGANSLIGGFAPGQATTPGGAGLVTLIGGGSSNNFIEATGSLAGGQNVLTAGGTGTVLGGQATLVGTATTTKNTFNAGNANSLVVSTSGAGLQTYNMVLGGTETVTGSTVTGASNLFLFNESSVSAQSSDVITNFSFGQDTLSITGGAVIQQVTTITGGAYNGFTQVVLSDGTSIKLTSLAYSSNDSVYVGKTSF